MHWDTGGIQAIPLTIMKCISVFDFIRGSDTTEHLSSGDEFKFDTVPCKETCFQKGSSMCKNCS